MNEWKNGYCEEYGLLLCRNGVLAEERNDLRFDNKVLQGRIAWLERELSKKRKEIADLVDTGNELLKRIPVVTQELEEFPMPRYRYTMERSK